MRRAHAVPPVTERLDAAPLVYVTFDDGPDPVWTPRVLDLLAACRAPAAFFVIGKAARQHPALIRRIAAEGHRLGNHTWSHRHPWLLLPREARREVRDGAAAIADAAGQAPHLFRPPHGRVRRCMIDEAERGRQQLVLWSLSAIDWGPFGSAGRIAARLDRVRQGDVILMHDGRPTANRPSALLETLPRFFDSLARKRLTAAPLPAAVP